MKAILQTFIPYRGKADGTPPKRAGIKAPLFFAGALLILNPQEALEAHKIKSEATPQTVQVAMHYEDKTAYHKRYEECQTIKEGFREAEHQAAEDTERIHTILEAIEKFREKN